jgi:hypothetical protein
MVLMPNGGQVKLYLDHVLVKVNSRSEEFLEGVALQIQAETKVKIQQNGQIDTGFMLNSTYTVSKRGDTYSAANQSGQSPGRKLAPKASLPGNAKAATVVGAQYAIYQEARKSFLYAAGEKVANQVMGSAEAVYKEGLSG